MTLVHASVELIEAMRGAEPWATQPPADTFDDFLAACSQRPADPRPVLAGAGYARSRFAAEDARPVTCPRCLDLMHEARGPERNAALAVRDDWREEHGLSRVVAA